MTVEPTEVVPLGRTGLSVTRLGFGAASIGGLFETVDEADAVATVRYAWDLGIRCAPSRTDSKAGTRVIMTSTSLISIMANSASPRWPGQPCFSTSADSRCR